MRLLARQLAHLSLTALILVSLTGISVKRHFCMGQHVYSTLSFLGKTCMDGQMPSDSPCCQNEYAHLQVLQEFQVVTAAVSLEVPPPIPMPEAPSSITLVQPERLLQPRYRYYRPPNLCPDIPVLFATFLI